MQSENPLLDRFAKLLSGAAGAARGLRDDASTLIKAQAERLANELELVSREEFEAVSATAEHARTEVERLAARLAVLETRIAQPADKPRRTVRNSPVRKRSPGAKRRRRHSPHEE